jgi:aminoglycoside phosphotransferase (APT) family kinase protein
MLSRADSELAARDKALARGLRLLLDEEAFTRELRLRLPLVEVEAARATYVRYKPGTNCLVAYRMKVGKQEFDLYAKAQRSGDGLKLKAGGARVVIGGALAPGQLVLEGETVVVSFFPHDGKLKALARLADDKAGAKLLRAILPECRDLWGGRLETLRYKPERRYVARLTSASGACDALLKVHHAVSFRAAHASARAFSSRGVLRVARLLGADEQRGMLACEWLRGDAIDGLLAREGSKFDVALIGEALAELHAQEGAAATLPRPARGAEANALAGIATGLAHIAPREGARVSALAREIAHRLSEQEADVRPVHGDFYASQVLIEGGSVAILDLDEAHLGDPASDLGNFLAHLEREAARVSVRAHNSVAEIKAALLEGYGRASGRAVPPALVAAQTSAALLKLAHQPFRLRENDWPEQTAAIIERAGEILAAESRLMPRAAPASGSQATKAFAGALVSDPFGAADDAAMPFLRRALDPTEFLHRLRESLEERGFPRGHVVLRAVRVTRHKLGRRCLVEYDLTCRRPDASEEFVTLVGKARAKGADARSFHLAAALRAAGFNEQCLDGVSVPEPIALIPEFQMWLQRKAPGVASGEALAGASGARLARRIAVAIDKLQRAGVEPLRRHTIEDELRILRERLAHVAAERSGWRARLERLMGACLRLAASLPATPARPVHRDFYPDQVLADGERLHLLDFDLYATGDPALDAGNFIAHLRELSLRTTGDADALCDRERELEESFVQLSGDVTRAAVRAYATLTLARHIHISTLFADRRPFTETILEMCERRLDVSRRATPCDLPPTLRPEGKNHATSIP